MTIAQHAKEKIEKALEGAQVSVEDTTGSHIDHNPGAHLAITVIHDSFRDKTLVEQHQTINNILQEELQSNQIHALQLITKVPS